MINKKYVCGDRLTKSRTLLITIKSINGDLYFSVQCSTVEGLKQNAQLWTVLPTLAEHPTVPSPPPPPHNRKTADDSLSIPCQSANSDIRLASVAISLTELLAGAFKCWSYLSFSLSSSTASPYLFCSITSLCKFPCSSGLSCRLKVGE